MGRGMQKDISVMLKTLERQGCRVSRTGNGHWRVERQGYRPIFVPATPGDPRTVQNVKSDVKRNLGLSL